MGELILTVVTWVLAFIAGYAIGCLFIQWLDGDDGGFDDR